MQPILVDVTDTAPYIKMTRRETGRHGCTRAAGTQSKCDLGFAALSIGQPSSEQARLRAGTQETLVEWAVERCRRMQRTCASPACQQSVPLSVA